MDLQLKGQRALVTASTGGIGLEIARVLAREGADVIVNGRTARPSRPPRARVGCRPVATQRGC